MSGEVVLDPRDWERDEWSNFGTTLTQTTGILLSGVALGGTVALKMAFNRTCTSNILATCNKEFQQISGTFVEPVAVVGAVVLVAGFALAMKEEQE